MGKPQISISYDTLQSHSGLLTTKSDTIYFTCFEVIGNNLVVYVSDNGWTEKGRIGAIYNLSDYNIKIFSV